MRQSEAVIDQKNQIRHRNKPLSMPRRIEKFPDSWQAQTLRLDVLKKRTGPRKTRGPGNF